MVAMHFLSRKPWIFASGQRGRRWFGGMVAVWVWSVWSVAWGMEPAEILSAVDRKMHAPAHESFNRITFELPNGRQRTLTLYCARASGRRALAVVVSPDELRGRAVLRVEDEVWLHMPGELETRKTSLMLSFVGGVFNNADFLLGDFSEEYVPTLLKEEESMWTLSLKPRTEHTPYARVELKVDKKNLMPLELSQFDASGFRLKTIHYQDVRPSEGDRLLPMLMETASGMNQAYRSSWRVGRLESREFPANAFTREFLPHAGRLMK
ncbi:MAG: outer membrane lipoprotein-sorting protein [Magnetococcales bacterium]|nr:outer membrane lipoprotein-sorting protein [Magnetococcales bacterium]